MIFAFLIFLILISIAVFLTIDSENPDITRHGPCSCSHRDSNEDNPALQVTSRLIRFFKLTTRLIKSMIKCSFYLVILLFLFSFLLGYLRVIFLN